MSRLRVFRVWLNPDATAVPVTPVTTVLADEGSLEAMEIANRMVTPTRCSEGFGLGGFCGRAPLRRGALVPRRSHLLEQHRRARPFNRHNVPVDVASSRSVIIRRSGGRSFRWSPASSNARGTSR